MYISQNMRYIFNKPGREEKCPYTRIQEFQKNHDDTCIRMETFMSECLPKNVTY